MRFSSSLLAISTLALTVSASTIHRRQAGDVKTCATSIVDFNPMLDLVLGDISRLTIDGTTNPVNPLLSSEEQLETSIIDASNICCAAVYDVSTTTESDTVFNALTTVVPKFEEMLSGISGKKTDKPEYEFANKYFRDVIYKISTLVDKLKECLVNHAPQDKLEKTASYDSRIDTALMSAKAAFSSTNPSSSNAPAANGADTKPISKDMPSTATGGSATADTAMNLAPGGTPGTTTGTNPPQ